MPRKKIRVTGISAILVLLVLINLGCQRDDICPESTLTTPVLNIAFFDITETDIPKAPVNLRVKAVDYDSIYVNRYNQSTISIPLRTDVDITQYEFTINAPELPVEGEEEEPGENTNMDVLTFTYNANTIFVNRACSYKVNYLDLQASIEEDDSNWIQLIEVRENDIEVDIIENEAQTHIHIYH
jgi:hypothetical protein